MVDRPVSPRSTSLAVMVLRVMGVIVLAHRRWIRFGGKEDITQHWPSSEDVVA